MEGSTTSSALGMFGIGFLVLGILGMGLSWSVDSKHFWHVYLVMFMFYSAWVLLPLFTLLSSI